MELVVWQLVQLLRLPLTVLLAQLLMLLSFTVLLLLVVRLLA